MKVLIEWNNPSVNQRCVCRVGSSPSEAGTSHPVGWIPAEKQQLLLKYVGAEQWHPLGGSDSD